MGLQTMEISCGSRGGGDAAASPGAVAADKVRCRGTRQGGL
eukprot:CAMPEP_0202399182 /NCGR_PEP_ID=MMETSP1128-20130828/1843_1 /ASSEMBLY_ACC=CAM_ASM_000463 /TAXON_ID=3047 /ORGANISM="Dunaliella tertiolecta, Strain CCMP1320" /LENGTH=40 /DNA_ID= /DNA_START= /DNA_END= /DNA_ORIENTATION=